MFMNEQLEKVASALRGRGFEAVVFDTREQAVAHILRELGSAQEVGMGGSATLAQLKLDAVLREAGHTVHWHQGAPKEEGPAIRRAAMCAQSYFASANAVANFANSAGCSRKGPKTSHDREPFISCGLNIVTNNNNKNTP